MSCKAAGSHLLCHSTYSSVPLEGEEEGDDVESDEFGREEVVR
jgi:hypothetical protein